MTTNDPAAMTAHWPGPEPAGSARRVYLGILGDIDNGRMVPGQRLVETELALRFEVGRNAVREAIWRNVSRCWTWPWP
jgi:DNA-binding GntR family transcriptional regulator